MIQFVEAHVFQHANILVLRWVPVVSVILNIKGCAPVIFRISKTIIITLHALDLLHP